MGSALPPSFLYGALCCLLLSVCLGCTSPTKEEHHFSGPTMGTWYNVKIIAPLNQEERSEIAQAVEDVLQSLNGLMSTYEPDSELSQLNQHPAHTPFALSTDTLTVLRKAQQVSQETQGAFDVTIGPLVNAWGFGPNNSESPPDAEEIQALLDSVGYEKLELDESAGAIRKEHANLYLDLSAIAKGYAVDKVAESLEENGLRHFMVDIGGEIVARGHNAYDKPWQIAIEAPLPETRSIHRVLSLQDIALATSGDYRNFIQVDGETFSHTIDPTTGRPVLQNLASVSVLHDSCALADAYATAIMVLGAEKGLEFAEKQDLAVFLLVHDTDKEFREESSSAFRALFPEN